MNPFDVDFHAVFESLPDAVAVCDEEGWVATMNQQARDLLGVQPNARVRLNLRARETVRQMRLSPVTASPEFYLADVLVEGASRTRASISLFPVIGGYRVMFAAPSEGTKSVNVRLLEGLVNVGRHLELFKTPDKVLALFAASFADVFPQYSFRIHWEGSPPSIHDQAAWSAIVSNPAPSVPDGHVADDHLMFDGAGRGYRLSFGADDRASGFLQVEKVAEDKFSVSERQAFETFVQQLGVALDRIAARPALGAMGPIIDQLDAIVLVCDSRRRIQVSNKTFETLTGGKSVVGRDVMSFFHEADAARLRTSAAAAMGGGAPESFDATLRAGGSDVTLRLTVSANRSRDSEGGFIVTGQHGEMSLVELEERLTRADHLMNLGQLATGVAHELKNPLTSILNYAEYLQRKYAGSLFEERDSERLQRIIEGVERIDTFVKDLVTLARPGDGAEETVSLEAIVREASAMCEVPLRNTRTRLVVESSADHAIVCVRGQIQQVFVNLLTNAAASMPESGGTVRISTTVSKGTVVCRVEDDARGMAPETLEKIFEPFFTTREGRGGSGLGLAIVKSIVVRHGGEISAASRPGVGSTFVLTFPLARR